MFSLADGATISAKKDGLVNTGGVLLIRDDSLARRANDLLILTEGFVTYGGLSGRDLEAMAQGFNEVLDEDYLQYRIRSIAYLGEHLLGSRRSDHRAAGWARHLHRRRRRQPAHPAASNSQARRFWWPSTGMPAFAPSRSAASCSAAVAAESRELAPALELVRLAIPRRVYTQSHIDYVVEAVVEVYQNREKLRGLRIVDAPAVLRHFTAKFEEL